MKAKASTRTRKNARQGSSSPSPKDLPPPTDPREVTHRKIVAFLRKEFARTGPRECVSLELRSTQIGGRGESIFAWDWTTIGAVEANKGRDVDAFALSIIRTSEEHATGCFYSEICRYELRSGQRTGGQARLAFRILQEGTQESTQEGTQEGTPVDRSVARPFVLKIEASGVHVDVRVDSARSLGEISRSISDGLSDALIPLMPALLQKLSEVGRSSSATSGSIVDDAAGDPIDLVGLATRILSGAHAPDDDQLELLLDLLRAERDRRVESRS